MIISPSILSADFGHLDRDIDMVNASDAQWLHIDVMDGVFVPNISFGFPVIDAIRKRSTKPLDVHLMIVQPQNYITRVRDCGAEWMNVHYEACTHLHRTIQQIKDAGMRPAVTLNPATPVALLQDIISDVEMVLLMSVNPGFGGQKFIEHTYKKIIELRELIDSIGCDTLIQVDGGVNLNNAVQLAHAGADSLVAGNAIFKSQDPTATIAEMAAIPRM